MYIIEHRELIDASEPQLGYLTEHELFEEVGEGRQLIIVDMVYNQEVPVSIGIHDDVTNEEIELFTSNYFTDKEIEIINKLFEGIEWTEVQLIHILLVLR